MKSWAFFPGGLIFKNVFKVVSLPSGYSAVVLQAGRGQGLGERQDQAMRGMKRVSEITVWNYDKIPSEHDQLRKAMQWVKLAEIMHDEDEEKEEENSDQDKS